MLIINKEPHDIPQILRKTRINQSQISRYKGIIKFRAEINEM
jgi:hypothetical protein